MVQTQVDPDHGCHRLVDLILIHSFSNSSVINIFLQYILYTLFDISVQFVLSFFDTACILFDKQLKPILVILFLVKIIPGVLWLNCLFIIAFSKVFSGIWWCTRSQSATAVTYWFHMAGVARLYFLCSVKKETDWSLSPSTIWMKTYNKNCLQQIPKLW